MCSSITVCCLVGNLAFATNGDRKIANRYKKIFVHDSDTRRSGIPVVRHLFDEMSREFVKQLLKMHDADSRESRKMLADASIIRRSCSVFSVVLHVTFSSAQAARKRFALE